MATTRGVEPLVREPTPPARLAVPARLRTGRPDQGERQRRRPYGIVLAGSGVDGLLGSSRWFVDDLNAAFAAGGFPGALRSGGYIEPPAGLREGHSWDLLRL